MNHQHVCQWCDGRYPGTTVLIEGEDEHGRPRAECECPVQNACPECEPRPTESEVE